MASASTLVAIRSEAACANDNAFTSDPLVQYSGTSVTLTDMETLTVKSLSLNKRGPKPKARPAVNPA